MEVSELTVRLVVAMLPGVVAALIVESLTVHKAWGSFRFALYSFLLGICSYLILQILLVSFHCLIGKLIYLGFWGSIQGGATALDFREVGSAIAIAVLLGGFVAAGITGKWVHLIAKKLRISEKYGDESLFYFFLNSRNVFWVRVLLTEKEKIYEGYRESFSTARGVSEILLRDVRVYRLKDAAFLYKLDSAYLSSKNDSLVIEQP